MVMVAIAGAVLMLGLVILGVRKILYHFRMVEPGKLYRSGTLGPVGLRVIDRLFGVNVIVNLRSESECKQGDWFVREVRYCRQEGDSAGQSADGL